MESIENKAFDEERALYGSRDVQVKSCRFEGPADGESAFKECSDIAVENSFFDLRYPFWHDRHLKISDCELTENCRAAIWYSDHIRIATTKLHGIKALRECSNVNMENCDVVSPEFGWSCSFVNMSDTNVTSEYFMMHANDLDFDNITLNGKYSFQYVDHGHFSNCTFTTKDAFWHACDIMLENCTLRGEYIGWYSDHVTLINCHIVGTQPFCYCKNLKLIDCTMEGCDLAFEKSEVEACILSSVESVKNPLYGSIEAQHFGEIILDTPTACEIHTL